MLLLFHKWVYKLLITYNWLSAVTVDRLVIRDSEKWDNDSAKDPAGKGSLAKARKERAEDNIRRPFCQVPSWSSWPILQMAKRFAKHNMNGKKCENKCGRVNICRVKGCGLQHSASEHPTDSWLSATVEFHKGDSDKHFAAADTEPRGWSSPIAPECHC
jgi:hypothetical protein